MSTFASQLAELPALNQVVVPDLWQQQAVAALRAGQDVVVAATLSETTWYNYAIGFPFAGHWAEIFNSDVYDNWVNPIVAGNGGGIVASDAPLHGLPASASIVIPANGLVVFTRG